MRIPLTLALLLVAAPVHAQGYVGGYTVDSATSEPLPCVEVALVDTSGCVVTRQLSVNDGMFQLDAPPRGVYRLRFSVWYHEPLVGPGEELEPIMERARKYALAFRTVCGSAVSMARSSCTFSWIRPAAWTCRSISTGDGFPQRSSNVRA